MFCSRDPGFGGGFQKASRPGDPVGIRWGSAGDPKGIRYVFGGSVRFEPAKTLHFRGDPVEPVHPYIILIKGNGIGRWLATGGGADGSTGGTF